MSARVSLSIAAAIVVLHYAMRWAGLAIHTSALAGMPESAWSLPIAGAYVVAYLAAVVVAPVLVLGVVLEAALRAAAGIARRRSRV
jgi:hypothetical protein